MNSVDRATLIDFALGRLNDAETAARELKGKTVTVKVVADGQELTFTLHTDKENLEDALVEHNLIDGDMDVYGMYIKKVNGIVDARTTTKEDVGLLMTQSEVVSSDPAEGGN